MAFSVSRRHLNHLTAELTRQDNSHLLHLHYNELDDKNFKLHGQTLFYVFILFSVSLLVSLLLLYVRWYFRFRHLNTRSQQPHAPHAPVGPTKGLEEAVIKAMPILLHQKSGVERDEEMECCICLGVFDDGDKVKVLHECQHRFHSECVDRWLLSQPTCPLCRVDLKPPPPTDLELGQV